MKIRSLTGTIGATLPGGAALLAQPQNQTPATQAPTAPAALAERQATFKKALGTCLQGRGYTTG